MEFKYGDEYLGIKKKKNIKTEILPLVYSVRFNALYIVDLFTPNF